MRGDRPDQSSMFSYISPEMRVPADHPLRIVKQHADLALASLSRQFDGMYSHTGRPSIPPETLLKAQLLIVLYSVRSDRLFCEMLDYNILFQWFLDLSMDDRAFDHSVFSKNRERLMEQEIGRQFFRQIVEAARGQGLLSDEHFTVDGTLIEAWASLKSFVPRDGSGVNKSDDDPGNPTVNFHGEKRGNATHQSKTDPEAMLARKSRGTTAKMSYAGHVLMENRSGLCVDIEMTAATGKAEREAALTMVRRERRRGQQRFQTLGADKGYHSAGFVKALRGLGIKPHIAVIDKREVPGLDGRTTGRTGYQISQRIRKRVEEIFGWFKTVGGFRKTRVKGTRRNQETAYLTATAYNLLRMARLKSLELAPG